MVDITKPSPQTVKFSPGDLEGGMKGNNAEVKAPPRGPQFSVQTRMKLKKLTKFWEVKVVQLLCVIYICLFTFTYAGVLGPYGGLVDPNTGFIIDPNSAERTEQGVILVNGDLRPVVANSNFQMFCLAISRSGAFSLYPVMILVFVSKAKATMSWLGSTPVFMWMFEDLHELHIYCGEYILTDATIHTLLHLVRWGVQGNIHLLWTHRTGLSGLFGIIATFLVAIPMIYMKRMIKYEIRKALHYLFYMFTIGLAYHVPMSGIPNGGFIGIVMGFCIVLYTLDTLIVWLFMTEKIETTIFHVLPSGVQMTMAVSESFEKRGQQGGFAYVCLPWVDRKQWHAFSLFENPANPSERQVFMLKTGDWTKDVHQALQRSTVRPVWISGPFASPYNNAESYDNQILVASGIGITPALSVIRAHKETRRQNLIWAVRDVAMLEFFLDHLYLDHKGWNLIFYTGKAPLNPALEELNTNVVVVKKRPDLHTTIPNIVYGIESGKGVPERYIPSQKVEVKQQLTAYVRELDETDLTSNEKLIELTTFAQNQGFIFADIVNNLQEDEGALSKDELKPDFNSAPIGDFDADDLGLSTRDVSVGNVNQDTLDGDSVLQLFRSYGEKSMRFSDYTPKPIEEEPSDVDQLALLNTPRKRSSVSNRMSLLRTGGASMRATVTRTKRVSFAVPGARGRASDSGAYAYHNLRKYMSTNLVAAFKPWLPNDEAKAYVKTLDVNSVLATWGILYCGGSKPVEMALKTISEEYHLALATESFAW